MPKAGNHDFSSLSVRDLLEAREAYHVHLAHLRYVYATAIGRYLIRVEDENARDSAANGTPGDLGPRTLTNSDTRDWSWPCVLVFVSRWFSRDELVADPTLAQELVPSFLYLPDGRVVPTCVILVDPDEAAPAPETEPAFKSDLIGGGYPLATRVQGRTHIGSIGCLVTDGEEVFAITNRHVCGEAGREVYAGFKGGDRRLGVSAGRDLGRRPFAEVYPGWPGDRTVANLDAGLVRIDDVGGWTAQVYGMGEVGQIWDLNARSFRLDVIGCPLVAYGAASGMLKGRILGLFYRYKTVGGIDYVSDFAIGPRGVDEPLGTLPGDSGTIWFEDDAGDAAPRNAAGAPIRRPVALQWGGQRLLGPGGQVPTRLALGICLATVCRELDVEIIPEWNVGRTEYWGEWGHVKIGAFATSLIDPKLKGLASTMAANAANIGLDDRLLARIEPYHKGDFAPLADVADLVWRFTRKSDENNHFADMDKAGPDGKTLLDLCSASDANISPDVWNSYYESVGEERRGALPFRVWQIYDEMVDFVRAKDVTRFVCAAGILAHYVGDACQPLHISQYHHGKDLSDKPHTKVHSIYETDMIGRHGADLLAMIPAAVTDAVAPLPGRTPDGHDAAVAVVSLMRRTVARLAPLTIVDLFDSHMGPGQIEAMWAALKEPTAACMQDGAKTLARIWEGAWRAGGGGKLPAAGTLEQSDLSALYRAPNTDFLPAYRLQDVVVRSGRIEHT